MKAANWIDRVKVTRGWESDYRVSKELGLSKQTIGSYRGKIGTMDEETAIKVTTALEIDPVILLADQALERARNEEARSAWAELIELLAKKKAPHLAGLGIGGNGENHKARKSAEKREVQQGQNLAAIMRSFLAIPASQLA